MATTNQYLHLAGVVFRDEAAALEERMLGGGRTFYPTERTSAALASPDPSDSHEHDPADLPS